MTETQKENSKKVGPIGERLQALINHYHLNMNRLSIQLNMPSNSIITRIIRDPGRGMSLELLQKILLEFPDINPDWLVCDRGEMLRDGSVLNRKENPCLDCPAKDEEIKRLTLRVMDCLEEKNRKSEEINELLRMQATKDHRMSDAN